MDAEDKIRSLSNKAKILAYLQKFGYASNHRLRGIGGSRAMGRVHELQKDGHDITIRKIKGSEWEIRLNQKPLGRDAGRFAQQKSLFGDSR